MSVIFWILTNSTSRICESAEFCNDHSWKDPHLYQRSEACVYMVWYAWVLDVVKRPLCSWSSLPIVSLRNVRHPRSLNVCSALFLVRQPYGVHSLNKDGKLFKYKIHARSFQCKVELSFPFPLSPCIYCLCFLKSCVIHARVNTWRFQRKWKRKFRISGAIRMPMHWFPPSARMKYTYGSHLCWLRMY